MDPPRINQCVTINQTDRTCKVSRAKVGRHSQYHVIHAINHLYSADSRAIPQYFTQSWCHIVSRMVHCCLFRNRTVPCTYPTCIEVSIQACSKVRFESISGNVGNFHAILPRALIMMLTYGPPRAVMSDESRTVLVSCSSVPQLLCISFSSPPHYYR